MSPAPGLYRADRRSPVPRGGKAAVPLSIGLPVRNGAEHLDEALRSLRAQTFVEFELLVSDNGSTDATPDIIADHAGADGRIRWERHDDDRGAAFNYNHVFDRSSGVLFKWASHDDLCAPTLLERCVEHLEASGPGVALAYPQTVLIDGAGRPLGRFEDRLDLRSPSPARRLRAFAMRWRLANVLFGVIRSDVLDRTRLIQPFVSSDLTLIAELALRGQFHELPEPLFFRRVHAGSSRADGRSTAEVADWFEPGTGSSRGVPPLARVWGSTIAALAAASDVPVGPRAGAVAAFAESWAEKRARAGIGRARRRMHRTHPLPGSAERSQPAVPPVS